MRKNMNKTKKIEEYKGLQMQKGLERFMSKKINN